VWAAVDFVLLTFIPGLAVAPLITIRADATVENMAHMRYKPMLWAGVSYGIFLAVVVCLSLFGY